MVLEKIISVFNTSENIAILPHISADGDAIGSSLALAQALVKLNRKAVVFLEESIPAVYNFLPGCELAKVFTTDNTRFDAVVALDTGDIGRLGDRKEIFEDGKITINIDHHNTNSEFAFYNYVSTGSSAVGEIIYQLIKMMGLEIDSDMSTCLYVAIATDSGGFRFSNTTKLTHLIISDLISKGISVAEVSQKIFDSTSFEKVKLMGAAADSLELVEKGKIAIITITNDVLKKSGAKEEDCDGIINMGRNIRGVEVAVMLRQWDNGEIKVNLRSNSNLDVSAIASMYNGGGHKKAAGYITKGSLDDVKNKLLKDIKEVL
jgi:bifunctional oligoribonuclease and PAP phosphatase NrnA